MDQGQDESVAQARPASDRKKGLWSVAVVVVGLVLAGLIARTIASHGGATTSGNRRMPASVAVAKAAVENVPVTLSAVGTVTPSINATVRPQQAGVVFKILFREGQLVSRGQPLAQIDPRPFVLAQSQARANLARDTAQLDLARADLRRYQTLWSQDSIARQQVDSQGALVKQLEGTVAADRAALGTAGLNLGYTTVRSPVAGRIGLRQVDIGNFVTASDANGIAVVTVVDPIDVVFSLPQAQLAQVQAQIGPGGAGLRVTALDQATGQQIAVGSLLTFDNTIDATTGTVKAKARFANPAGRLFPNQFVNVSMLVNTLPNAVVVPIGAVRHGAPGDFVFVLQNDHTVKLVVVKTGPIVGQNIAILSGLKAGDSVVTAGADGLDNGSAVRLPGDRAPGAAGSGGAKAGAHKGASNGRRTASGQ